MNDETQQLGAGDLVYIPPNSTHAIKVLGEEEVHALMVYEPGGYERNYFRRRAVPVEEQRDPEVMRKLMHEAEILLAQRSCSAASGSSEALLNKKIKHRSPARWMPAATGFGFTKTGYCIS